MNIWFRTAFLLAFGCFLVSACAHQQSSFREAIEKPLPKEEPKFFTFTVSSEMEIGKVWPILLQAPKGIYVSVGSERSFRAASMADAEELLILDISPNILRFSNINRVLLKARDLEFYKQLRFSASFKEWQDFEETIQDNSLSKDDYDWWVKNVRNIESGPNPYPEMFNRKGFDVNWKKFVGNEQDKSFSETTDECFNKWKDNPEAALDYGSIIDFRTGNYLFDSKLYGRLHKLALKDRIYVVHVDLTDKNALQELISKLKSNGKTIGVLDLDNLYNVEYIGDKAYRAVLEHFLQISSEDSILLAMAVHKWIGCLGFQVYFGFRFGFVKQWSNDFELTRYILALPFNLLYHMDGKLYSKKQLPPFWNSWEQHAPTIPETIFDKKWFDSREKK